jgi:hypothetical protein
MAVARLNVQHGRFMLSHLEVCRREYCDRKPDLEMLTDLQVFMPSDYEKLIFGMPSVSLSVCVYGPN